MAATGGCLCGRVRFELDGELGPIANCHCQFCRRAHGAAFVTTTLVDTADLRFTRGEDAIARHEGRHFCHHCATRLYNRSDAMPDRTSLMLSSLDEQPSTPPHLHLNVESKAPWYEIRDGAPQFDALPPQIEAMLKREDPK